MSFASIAVALVLNLLFFAAPESSNFRLQSYGIGSGGSSNSSSTNFRSSTISGEQGNATGSDSTTYQAGTGLIPTQQANVPSAPAITNPSNYYNKLHIVIDNGSNPTDATFAIAISTDGFSPTTNFVQNDNTVGTVLGAEDWQTYSSWGGASGFDVIGLLPNTTYTIKVKAEHGDFTESGYSATSSAATANPSITFDIDVASTDTESAPPYNINFGNLLVGTVVNSSDKLWIDFATNGESGGIVFISSANSGLNSSIASYTINTATGNLSSLNEGYGAQSASATQSSGGPLTAQSPYDVASNNVGVLDNSFRRVYLSSGPIVAGRGSIQLKAKSQASTPASTDYNDTLTITTTASF